jgi:hypothetical protein
MDKTHIGFPLHRPFFVTLWIGRQAPFQDIHHARTIAMGFIEETSAHSGVAAPMRIDCCQTIVPSESDTLCHFLIFPVEIFTAKIDDLPITAHTQK